jgi:hypothetical protein
MKIIVTLSLRLIIPIYRIINNNRFIFRHPHTLTTSIQFPIPLLTPLLYHPLQIPTNLKYLNIRKNLSQNLQQ